MRRSSLGQWSMYEHQDPGYRLNGGHHSSQSGDDSMLAATSSASSSSSSSSPPNGYKAHHQARASLSSATSYTVPRRPPFLTSTSHPAPPLSGVPGLRRANSGLHNDASHLYNHKHDNPNPAETSLKEKKSLPTTCAATLRESAATFCSAWRPVQRTHKKSRSVDVRQISPSPSILDNLLGSAARLDHYDYHDRRKRLNLGMIIAACLAMLYLATHASKGSRIQPARLIKAWVGNGQVVGPAMSEQDDSLPLQLLLAEANKQSLQRQRGALQRMRMQMQPPKTATSHSSSNVAILIEGERLKQARRLICGFAASQQVGEVSVVSYTTYEDSHWDGLGEECRTGEKLRYLALDSDLLETLRPSVLLIAEPLDAKSHDFSQLVASARQMDVVVIEVPQADIPHIGFVTTLDLASLRSWHVPQIDFIVITHRRPWSLQRLLTSLKNAIYFGDRVGIQLSIEAMADSATHEIARHLDHFWSETGTVAIRSRVVQGGLMASITESWFPVSDHHYGVMLEDDIELSPLFYAWTKYNILHYRYSEMSKTNGMATKSVFGISLYQPKTNELRMQGRVKLSPKDLFQGSQNITNPLTPYLSQVPCSWGAVYFPEHWREFHTWLSHRVAETTLPLKQWLVPEIRSNRWNRSWKRFFNEMVYFRGYTMLYPNYPDWGSFSTNHVETGDHVHEPLNQHRMDQFEVPLIQADNTTTSSRDPILDDLPGKSLPRDLRDLPVLDLWGYLADDLSTLVRRGVMMHNTISLCDPRDEVEVLAHGSDFNVSSILCDRTGIDFIANASAVQIGLDPSLDGPGAGIGPAMIDLHPLETTIPINMADSSRYPSRREAIADSDAEQKGDELGAEQDSEGFESEGDIDDGDDDTEDEPDQEDEQYEQDVEHEQVFAEDLPLVKLIPLREAALHDLHRRRYQMHRRFGDQASAVP